MKLFRFTYCNDLFGNSKGLKLALTLKSVYFGSEGVNRYDYHQKPFLVLTMKCIRLRRERDGNKSCHQTSSALPINNHCIR